MKIPEYRISEFWTGQRGRSGPFGLGARSRRTTIVALCLSCLLAVPSLLAEDVAVAGNATEEATPRVLKFSFASADWPSVLSWFAEQADLSLQLDQVPLGTFSFNDPSRAYSVSEGIDVINLTLMKRGYSLVRRGRLLQVIDLEAENADKLISEISELVRPEHLDERGNTDIVSTVFPLDSMTPQAARDELGQLIGPWGRVVVLESARQVKVTETASKLIAIRNLLQRATTAETEVLEVVLKHRSADELLEIARPLLELEPGQNSNESIRISIGPLSDRIYATGTSAKMGLLKSLIDKADTEVVLAGEGDGEEATLPVFQTHAINIADTTTVFDVLQTLLDGTPDARIAIDPKTNAIVAFARPQTHKMIQKSIAEMEGNGQDFKIIALRRLDPAQALLTINKFFGIDEGSSDGPTVDGDPETGRLWVRGTTDQIAIVERLISELEGSDSMGELSDKVRILPYTGKAAEDALLQIQSLWPITGRKNMIRFVAPPRGVSTDGDRRGIPERRIRRPDDSGKELTRPRSLGDTTQAFVPAKNRYTFVLDAGDRRDALGAADLSQSSQPGGDIIVQLTPAGVMVASEDPEALDAFESLMKSLTAPSITNSDLPTIYWLKYARAEEAAELISKILGGSESGLVDAVGDAASGLGGGMLGSLMGMGGGGGDEGSSAKSVLTSTGSVSIVPDARLNALIVQANATDLQMIELVLEKIDRAESPEELEISGRPGLIPVVYQEAADVANVVKEVMGDRIAGQSGNKNAGGNGGQPSPRDFFNALRGGGGGGNQEGATSSPNQINIAVDVKSNALVVVATPNDFNEVKALVEQIDAGGISAEETVTTYTLDGNVNPDVVRMALESLLGTPSSTQDNGGKPSKSQSTGTTSGAAGRSNTAQNASDIQRRIELFRSLRGGGGPGGGGGGRLGGSGGRPGGGNTGGGRPGGGRGR